MKNWPLRNKIIFIATLPAIITTLVLSTHLFLNYYTLVEKNLMEKGESLARQLGTPLAYALERQDRDQVRRIMDLLLQESEIRAVSVHDSERKNILHGGPSMNPVSNAGHRLQSQPLVRYSDNTLRIIQPLMSPFPSGQQAEKEAPATEKGLFAPQFVHMEITNNAIVGWLELEVHLSQTRLSIVFDVILNLVVVVILLIGTLFIAIRISRQLLDALAEIRGVLHQVSAGNYSVRARQVGCPEFFHLADDINSLTHQLTQTQKKQQEEMDQAAIELEETMTTMETQSVELDLARKRAEEANRIKSEFLANMSHEIRTPMNSIVGFCNFLRRSQLTPHQRSHLNSINNASENLLSIINDILDFSKIEAQKMEIQQLPFNLRETIDKVVSMLAPETQRKNLEMVSMVYRDVPNVVVGDSIRLGQVLTNLLGNAVKFTESGDVVLRVMVESEEQNSLVLKFRIDDKGVGIAEDKQAGLFTPFTQADSSQNRQYGGSGLGLVISKRLVELMGGEIGLSSSPGKGSTFWFTIRMPMQGTEHNEELPPANIFPRLHTLLVESHPLNAGVLQLLLENLGLKVTHHNTLNGISLQQPNAQLAVLAFNSQEAADRANQALTSKLAEQLPVLVLIGNNDAEVITRYMAAGARQVDSKPIGQEKLRQSVEAVLQQYPALLEQRSDDPTDRRGSISSARPVQKISDSNTGYTDTPAARQSRPETPLSYNPDSLLAAAPVILVVDDNPSNLRLASTLLDEFGTQVVQADSGKKAIEAILNQRPDLVLMDIQMPDMDGLETTRRIRNLSPQYEQLPIVALTAHALPEERERFMQSGLNDLLTKPIDEERLARLIQHWTGFSPNLMPAEPAPEVQEVKDDVVVDMEMGIQMAAGKPELAQEILDMLFDSIPEHRRALDAAFNSDDIEEMIKAVHHLNGATRYCGVPQLALTTEALETQLKTRQMTGAKKTLQALYKELEKLETWRRNQELLN